VPRVPSPRYLIGFQQQSPEHRLLVAVNRRHLESRVVGIFERIDSFRKSLNRRLETLDLLTHVCFPSSAPGSGIDGLRGFQSPPDAVCEVSHTTTIYTNLPPATGYVRLESRPT
jgi:hypothetical protein